MLIVLADCSNWRSGTPAPTTSLRGILDFIIEVRTLDHAVHSGVYGGPVPDALTALSRLIASLHDDRGYVAIDGLQSGPPYDIELNEADLRRYAGVRHRLPPGHRYLDPPALGPPGRGRPRN